jgi:hypothetical protein
MFIQTKREIKVPKNTCNCSQFYSRYNYTGIISSLQVTRPASVSQAPRRDDPPTYATAAAACTPSTASGAGGGLMHQPIAEREVPYEQYSSAARYSQQQQQQVVASEQIYSRVTPRVAAATSGQQHTSPSQNVVVADSMIDGVRSLDQTSPAAGGSMPTATSQELRQFSREPTVISFDRLSSYDVAGLQAAAAAAADTGIGWMQETVGAQVVICCRQRWSWLFERHSCRYVSRI